MQQNLVVVVQVLRNEACSFRQLRDACEPRSVQLSSPREGGHGRVGLLDPPTSVPLERPAAAAPFTDRLPATNRVARQGRPPGPTGDGQPDNLRRVDLVVSEDPAQGSPDWDGGPAPGESGSPFEPGRGPTPSADAGPPQCRSATESDG